MDKCDSTPLKACTKCGESKPTEAFGLKRSAKSGRKTACKTCTNLQSKTHKEENKANAAAYYIANKEKIIARSRSNYAENKDRAKKAGKAYRDANKASKAAQDKAYREANKEKISARNKARYESNPAKAKEYRELNKDSISTAMKNWRQSNRSKIAEYQRLYIDKNRNAIMMNKTKRQKERISEDPIYAMRIRASQLIRIYLRKGGYTKKSRCHEILGCAWDEFKSHIERQFTKGMSWERLGEIHLDHITPMATAKTESDVIALNHFTNLRPMWAKDNMSKGAQITHLI